jgi:hypothetical protein
LRAVSRKAAKHGKLALAIEKGKVAAVERG